MTERFRAGDIRHCFADTERISKELGYAPRMTLEDGISVGELVDIPEGQSAHLSVLDTASTIGYGYQVYPVPQNYAEDQSYTVQVAELFTMDADAYGQDAFYPASVAGLVLVDSTHEQQFEQFAKGKHNFGCLVCCGNWRTQKDVLC